MIWSFSKDYFKEVFRYYLIGFIIFFIFLLNIKIFFYKIRLGVICELLGDVRVFVYFYLLYM